MNFVILSEAKDLNRPVIATRSVGRKTLPVLS